MSQNKIKYFRVIDANLNRCREGLRVLEDTARFVLAQGSVYKDIRKLRHRVDKVTRNVYPELLVGRSSNDDAGRKIKEGKRTGLSAVVSANFKRVEESLRVLEEYGRIISVKAGSEFKKVRFKTYCIEKSFWK